MSTNNNSRNFTLTRKMGDFDVIQRTSDGMFDANALLKQWNASNVNKKKQMDKFLDNDKTRSFITTIAVREGLLDDCSAGDNSEKCIYQELIYADSQSVSKVVRIQKGRHTTNGRTPDRVWMHPLLFIDFAMWLNVEFKYDVLKFVQDQLIEYRNKIADSHTQWTKAMRKIGCSSSEDYADVQKMMNAAVFGQHFKGIRDTRTKEELDRYALVEQQVLMSIEFGFVKSVSDLRDFLKKVFEKYHSETLFNELAQV